MAGQLIYSNFLWGEHIWAESISETVDFSVYLAYNIKEITPIGNQLSLSLRVSATTPEALNLYYKIGPEQEQSLVSLYYNIEETNLSSIPLYYNIEESSADSIFLYYNVEETKPPELSLYYNIEETKPTTSILSLGYQVEETEGVSQEQLHLGFLAPIRDTFIINIYEGGSKTSRLLNWEMYSRNNKVHPLMPVDSTHTYVTSGSCTSGVIKINLHDYGLLEVDDDYYIKITDEYGSFVASTYVQYYWEKFVPLLTKKPYLFEIFEYGGSGTSVRGGEIQIEEGWQDIAVPIEFGYWDSSSGTLVHDDSTIARVENYIIRQLEDIYGVPGNTLIERVSTYNGDAQAFYSFIPGVTNPATTGNFSLVFRDNDGITERNEPAGIRLKNISGSTLYLEWGEA